MRREAAAMVTLAWPVVLAEIGWILMGVVDTIAVGPLGPAAIGAVGTGSTIFFALMVLGIGTLFALDTFVAQGFGAGHREECRRWLVAGLWLAGLMSVVLVGVGLLCHAWLPYLGMQPDVLVALQPYLGTLLWSVPPLLVYTVLRRYLQATDRTRPVLVAVIAANVINALANYVFVYGAAGVPAMGVVGAAWATLAARLCLAAILWWVVARDARGAHDAGGFGPRRPDLHRMWRLARLGIPAALQVMLEVGVFAAAGVLAAGISSAAAGAHQVVQQIAGFFFMVPLGLSSAAAVRVGQAVGRRDAAGARRAGWCGLVLAVAAAAAIACILVGAPTTLLRIFSRDEELLAMGSTLLVVCAVFQPFDSVQSVATGALRGLGETTVPMVANLAGHWLVGLPVGYVLCFTMGWGVPGLWVGLTTGLAAVGVTLLLAWHRRSAALVLERT